MYRAEPKFFSTLKQKRNCLVDSSAVSDTEETIDFRIDNDQRGGIIAEDMDNNPSTRGDQLKNATIISLKTVTLESVLERLNAPETIDYLSLDVEGSEERVLRNFDFDKYRIQCLTIERPTLELNKNLFENGYVFVKILPRRYLVSASNTTGKTASQVSTIPIGRQHWYSRPAPTP